MTDQPADQKTEESFKIPDPRIEDLKVSVADSMSLADAALEYRGFQSRSRSPLTRTWWDWLLTYVLKLILFGFVLAINIWWTRNVLKMVWLSGSQGSHFHLDNDVLITLVSTSIASFLGLVAIVTKNLFPESSK
jgi:hypothetical protein